MKESLHTVGNFSLPKAAESPPLLNKQDTRIVSSFLKRAFSAIARRRHRMNLWITSHFLARLPEYAVAYAGDSGMILYHKAQIELRRRRAKASAPLDLKSHDGAEVLCRSIQASNPPWDGIVPVEHGTPGMISREEAQYYEYISKFYSGAGEAVEFGPWLGKSTFHIASSLRRNPLFEGHKLHVFDDFVWRPEWMNSYVPAEKRLTRHADFFHLFQEYTAAVKDDIQVTKCRFAAFDGNEALPALSWNGGNIEMLFADCGRTLEGNNAWYSMVKKHLIPNRTLIFLQDWGTHREVPFKYYNQMHMFTGSLANELEIIHEGRDGTLAVFLYLGAQ